MDTLGGRQKRFDVVSSYLREGRRKDVGMQRKSKPNNPI
jgi:hypothetical protein